MESEQSFKTKTGYCYIFADKIVLTRNGVAGDISKITVGNSIARPLIVYGIIALGLFYFAYDSYLNDKYVLAAIMAIIGLWLIIGVFRSVNNSAAPVIERNKIKKAAFNKGKTGLTRPHFVIEFEDDNGKLKKRLIMLPGTLAGGQNEAKRALQIMEQEKIIKHTPTTE